MAKLKNNTGEISVAEATRRVIRGKPSILDCLRYEVINFSALAQMIMPEVLTVCKKEKVKLDAKKEEIKKIQEKLNLLKDNAKKKEQEKIANVAQEYREMERKIFIDLKKERDKKMEEIVDDINKVIKDYARRNGFDLIVNQNTVLYGAKSMDITSQILKEVNKQYKKRR